MAWSESAIRQRIDPSGRPIRQELRVKLNWSLEIMIKSGGYNEIYIEVLFSPMVGLGNLPAKSTELSSLYIIVSLTDKTNRICIF